MIKTETITTYWCDGCGKQVKVAADLRAFQTTKTQPLYLCSECISYIVHSSIQNSTFVPRLRCQKCSGTGADPNYKPREINWFDNREHYFSFFRYPYEGRCGCGRLE